LKAKTVLTVDGQLSFNLDESKGKPIGVSIWSTESDTKDFRQSKWVEKRLEKDEVLGIELKKGKWNASFVEARFSFDGRSFTLSTPVNVLYRE
jgi:PhoPQ-activated pathogenicity-related protein